MEEDLPASLLSPLFQQFHQLQHPPPTPRKNLTPPQLPTASDLAFLLLGPSTRHVHVKSVISTTCHNRNLKLRSSNDVTGRIDAAPAIELRSSKDLPKVTEMMEEIQPGCLI